MLNLSMLPPIKGGKDAFRKVERIAVDGEVVLTTEQLADFYGCTTDNIKKNFNANKDRFVEGEHFFKIIGDGLKELKNKVTESYFVGKNANTLYLWTKRGVARHSKMLGTEEAWRVFEKMEDTFFRVGASDAESIKKEIQEECRHLEAMWRNWRSERLRLECERENIEDARKDLEKERKLLIGAKDDKNIAKAKALNALAKSTDDKNLRDKLIRQAAALLS